MLGWIIDSGSARMLSNLFVITLRSHVMNWVMMYRIYVRYIKTQFITWLLNVITNRLEVMLWIGSWCIVTMYEVLISWIKSLKEKRCFPVPIGACNALGYSVPEMLVKSFGVLGSGCSATGKRFFCPKNIFWALLDSLTSQKLLLVTIGPFLGQWKREILDDLASSTYRAHWANQLTYSIGPIEQNFRRSANGSSQHGQ